jgi:hypothetical protein
MQPKIMRVDFSGTYNQGYDRLLMWRVRYSKHEYPFKVVVNKFYRHYTINDMWNTRIEPSFSTFKSTQTNIMEAFQKLQSEYSTDALKWAGDNLIVEMNKQKDVGAINYSDNISNISKSQNGSSIATEELEYAYLYYLLSNELILLWAAFGRCGYSEIEAIAQITGAVIEEMSLSYEIMINILGPLGAGQILNKCYSPLPSLY